MPAERETRFIVEAQGSFAVRLGAVVSFRGDPVKEQIRGRPSCIDTREAALSSTAREMQRNTRDRARTLLDEERRNDAESLYLLEAATATNSAKAKIKDRESLEVLMRHTNLVNEHRNAATTPAHRSFWPPSRYVKGLNGTPLSYEPPFSTPSAVRRSEMPATGNELEEILAKDIADRQRSNTESNKRIRSSFNAILASSKSSNRSARAGGVEASTSMKEQVESVRQWMNKVEAQDAEDELALEKDLAEAMESPVASPTLQIKHLPKDFNMSTWESPKSSESVKEDLNTGLSGILEPEEREVAKVRAEVAPPVCESNDDADEEWETVSMYSN